MLMSAGVCVGWCYWARKTAWKSAEVSVEVCYWVRKTAWKCATECGRQRGRARKLVWKSVEVIVEGCWWGRKIVWKARRLSWKSVDVIVEGCQWARRLAWSKWERNAFISLAWCQIYVINHSWHQKEKASWQVWVTHPAFWQDSCHKPSNTVCLTLGPSSSPSFTPCFFINIA